MATPFGIQDRIHNRSNMPLDRKKFIAGKALLAPWHNPEQEVPWSVMWQKLSARFFSHPAPARVLRDRRGSLGSRGASHAASNYTAAECALVVEEMHQLLQRETAQRRELEGEIAVTQAALRSTQSALIEAQHHLQQVVSDARRASHLALHDELTDLPNRRHLLEHLTQMLGTTPAHTSAHTAAHTSAHTSAHIPALTVLCIDLNAFKAVNDTHGHAVGDSVLRITAARLRGSVRAEDTVVRIGGDEFVCVLPHLSEEAPLRLLCAKLMGAVTAPMQIDRLQLVVRPSIGIASCPRHGETAAALLANADAATYTAKREGSGYAFCTA